MANLKFQNMESAICDLKFRVLARTRCSRFVSPHFLTAESGFKAVIPGAPKIYFLRKKFTMISAHAPGVSTCGKWLELGNTTSSECSIPS
jgi:hypothetical protein